MLYQLSLELIFYQGVMRKYLSFSLLLLSFTRPLSAFAGDAATVVLSSGATVKINNGYTQLVNELKEFNRVNKKGGEGYLAEINIEGSTFYINLSEVAVICRDSCSNVELTAPPKR